jgi:hypothetical protein
VGNKCVFCEVETVNGIYVLYARNGALRTMPGKMYLPGMEGYDDNFQDFFLRRVNL